MFSLLLDFFLESLLSFKMFIFDPNWMRLMTVLWNRSGNGKHTCLLSKMAETYKVEEKSRKNKKTKRNIWWWKMLIFFYSKANLQYWQFLQGKRQMCVLPYWWWWIKFGVYNFIKLHKLLNQKMIFGIELYTVHRAVPISIQGFFFFDKNWTDGSEYFQRTGSICFSIYKYI